MLNYRAVLEQHDGRWFATFFRDDGISARVGGVKWPGKRTAKGALLSAVRDYFREGTPG